MNTNDPRLELVRRCHDREASAAEVAELDSHLREDADFRVAYVRYAGLDVALSAAAREIPVRAAEDKTSPSHRSGWLQWRPLAAAAAGLAVGMFCTSIVWAYVAPLAEPGRVVPLFSESFEDTKLPLERGFPLQAGRWSGDLSGLMPPVGEVTPKDGESMVKLPHRGRRNFTFAARIVDLADHPMPSDAALRQVEVTASFHSVCSASAQRHQIRLAAFSEEPGEVKTIWNSPTMFDYVMQHVGRTVAMKPGDHGWQTLRATMEVPADARSLVIWLAVIEGEGAGEPGAHYLDAVDARFILTGINP
jgi:hypothetical protein